MALMTELPTITVGAVSLVTRSPTPVDKLCLRLHTSDTGCNVTPQITDTICRSTRPLASITKAKSPNIELLEWYFRPLDQWPSGQMGERKLLCVSEKCFTKFSKAKHFTIYHRGFYGQWKILYKFDYILFTNKPLKMGKNIEKYFTLKQIKSL